MHRNLTAFLMVIALFAPSPALSWNDATHMAVMAAAGFPDYAYLAVGADMAKAKSAGHEDGNHYCNNNKGIEITPDTVLDQVRDYDCRCFGQGHLYGAILAALDRYFEKKESGKYALYPLGYAAHYIGDLSNPLHNIVYDEFNMAHHAANDGAAEPAGYRPTNEKVAQIAEKIRRKMASIPPYRLTSPRKDLKSFHLELARKIAEIANGSIALGYAMRDAKPQRTVMTPDEAYWQLAQSAALLKAAFAAMQ